MTSPPHRPVDPVTAHPLADRGLRSARRLRRADRRRPFWADSLIALLVALIGLSDVLSPEADDPPPGLSGVDERVLLLLVACTCLPLVWRRKAPFAVCLALIAACTLQWVQGLFLHADLAVLIALYGLGRYASQRRLLVAGATVLVAAVILVWRVQDISEPFTALFFVCGTATAAIVLGLALRIRQAQLTALADRAAQLERGREQRVQLAISAERSRVSREMHDILGHTLAVIIGLADGGAYLATSAPERSAEALSVIAATGRQALGELRKTLAALREHARHPDAAELAPQPGTADLAGLLDRTRAAGPHVVFRTEGDITSPAPGIQLAIYRIVQEALANALKHAGTATSLHVTLRVTSSVARVSVQDTGPTGGPADGRAPAPAPDVHGGLGLIGIRERAALAGGHSSAGPLPRGGWLVEATFALSSQEEQR